jgi:hypothetical protein
MKNILVLKHYTLTDNFFCFSDMSAVAKHYKQAREIAVQSAEKYLLDLDEVIVDQFVMQHDQEMFKHHAELLRKRYQSEDCNILYCDLDIVFIKPTRIFGEYKDFTMCAQNCGVRYYPAGGMTEQQWDVQQKYVSNWKTQFNEDTADRIHNWDYEQDMYKAMRRLTLNPDIADYEQPLHPFEKVVHQLYNQPQDGYSMVHCYGTSQQFDGVQLMKQLYDLSTQNKYEDIHDLLSKSKYSLRRDLEKLKAVAHWLGMTE